MDGSIKIGDFGLVTAIEENCCDSRYSNTQALVLHDGRRHTDQVGTKLYMSPEQVSLCVYSFSSLVTDYFNPLSSSRQRLSYDVCLEVRGEIIRTVLCCTVY